MSKRKSYRVDKEDTLPDAIYKNGLLIDRLKRLEREVKKMRSENRTLQDAWYRTEDYLVAISENKTIKEIFNEIDTKTNLRKVRKKCPNSDCGNNNLNKRMFCWLS